MRPIEFRPGTADEQVMEEVFESLDYARVLRFQPPDRPLIVDAGAHIGCASRWFAQAFPDARVIALEPEFENYKLLVRNAAGFDIHPYLTGLVGTPGIIRVADRDRGTWGCRTERVDTYERGAVTGVTMAQVLDGQKLAPFVVKIDIEGAERDVFEGDVSWLDRVPVVIIEMHDDHPGLAGCGDAFRRAVVGRKNEQKGAIWVSERS